MIQARNIASNVLYRSQSGKHTLDQVLSQADQQIQRLHRADRALLHAIVYGVLRWQARLDWVIDHLTLRPGKKIDPLVRVILRMGIFQIHYLERIPISAAVNTCVELTKKKKRKWASGFVNSVLRRAADRGKEIPWPDRDNDPITFLSIFYAFPQWLISRWIGHWGMDETEALCIAINTIPPITIRTNTLRVDRQRLMEYIQTDAKGVSPTAHSPEGVSFSSVSHPLAHWKAFQKGWFQVQDQAAQLVTLLLDPRPEEAILDACAGLGGKTGHIAQQMKNSGMIVALDNSAEKLKQLNSQMQRLEVSIASSREHDLNVPPKKTEMGTFDRILLDAPCSGLGVLRRNPDAKWNISKKQLQRHGQKQVEFLNNLAHLVKPSGILVYVVCSNEHEENEDVVKDFLNAHPEFVQDPQTGALSSKTGVLMTRWGYLKTFPFPHNMDGFFSARFKRIR